MNANRQRRTRTLIGIACACALLLAVDLALRTVFRTTTLANEIVDIQSPAMLELKLEHLARHPGMKVVLLGDSLVYGRAMAMHGDAAWREHTLSALLQQRLMAAAPQRNPMVMNLALNGALPADFEQLVKLIAPARPGLVVINLNVRSFSEDFAKPGTIMSREWLADGEVSREPETVPAALNEGIEGVASGLMQRLWFLYRSRDYLHYRVMNAPPQVWLRRLRKRIGPRPEDQGGDAAFRRDLLLMKVKKRYETANLRADNPQRQALERTLALLEREGIPVVLFYGQEDSRQRGRVISKERYEALRGQLADVLRPHLGTGAAYVPGPEDIASEHYLDYVHVDREGYRMLAETLWPHVRRLVTK